MALVIADRVKETTTTTGTGTINLAGAVAAFQTFVAGIGTGNTCYYAITSGNNWEIGLGTVTDASPDTLSRTTILASSVSSAQATATLTFGDTEFDDVNNGTLALIDTAGLSKTYTIRNDYGATGATEFNAGAARGVAAANLAQIVESSNGHNGTIYAMDSSNVRFSSGGYDFSDGVVNLKQATDGSVGNTTITTAASFDNCTDVNIGSAFTGGGPAITLSGTSTVFATYPAAKSVHLDASGNLSHTGTWTFDESTSGTIGITTIQDSGSSFSDNDTSLMTSAAIADKITASGGGGATPYTTITGDTTVTTSNEVVFANATSGAIDVTLYLAASNGGKTLTVKKTDSSANAVSILRAGSETIDGATSTTLYHQNEAVTLISDNSNWLII
jgi:hypothetical protein